MHTCSPCLICFAWKSCCTFVTCKQHSFFCLTAAPEVISNKKHYDGVMADVWSSGVMLYVMLFGQYPFERPEDKKEANRCSQLSDFAFMSLSCLVYLGEDNKPCRNRFMHHAVTSLGATWHV